MNNKQNKNKQVNIRLSPDIYTMLKTKADKEQRTISNLVITILLKGLKK